MKLRHFLASLASLALICCVAVLAHGHELNTAVLSLTEVADGKFAVRWQASSPSLMKELRQPAEFPSPCKLRGDQLDCGSAGLAGAIHLPWLEGSETSVMVQIDWRSGSRLLRVVDGRSASLLVYGTPASSGLRFLKPIAFDYTRLGIEHILWGFDHLLFVLALTMLVRNGKRLLATITGFTLAHSITLTCTVLGWLSLPSAPVEAAIALSIVLVCAECLRPADTLTQRAPWIVAFAFGLLHGLGFASALQAIGLPDRHVPSALLFFNVGVELGQLFAIGIFLGAGWLWRRLQLRHAQPVLRGLTYTLGATAAFWTIERGLALFAN